jgi:hypothetical protein
VHGSWDDPRIAATARPLEAFAWRRLRTEMLARYVVAAVSRYWLRSELSPIPDPPYIGGLLEPAPVEDERVEVVVEALDACPWRSLTLAAVVGQSLRALEAWRVRRDWLDIELSWMLDDSS